MVSGGTLRLEKYFWYLITYKWVKGQWMYDNKTFDIFINIENNSRGKIKQLLPDTETEMMGIFMSPSGTSKKQVAAILTAIEKTNQAYLRKPLPRQLMWKGFRHCLEKSIDYKLPSASFS